MKQPNSDLARYAELLRTAGAETLSKGDVERVDEHIADALPAIEHLAPLEPVTIVDVGSGGGVPAIPLALCMPGVSVTLVESVQRKCRFLEQCAEELTSASIVVRCERSEDVAATDRESFDLATARALAPLPVTLEYLAPLVRVGGHAAVWTTTSAIAGIDTLDDVSRQLGFDPPVSISIPTSLRTDGALLLARKGAATPAIYPRRVGVAKKRPLG